MLDNTTTEYETITVQNFVERLQKNWEMLSQLDCEISRNDSWEKRVFPNGDFYELSELENEKDKPLLIELITNLFGTSSITSDVSLLDDCDYLSDKWMEIGKVVHQQCERGFFWFDFGDELSDRFSPMISERIKKFLEIGLTTESVG